MPLESRVDVLIIGAGPAGVMCANALAMAGVNVKIIDKRAVKVAAGHADGIAHRTIEVLQSYGLAGRLIREGNQVYVSTYYNVSCDGGIQRTSCVPLSVAARYQFAVTLHQGAIEDIFLESMRNYGVVVERPKRPVSIGISEDADELSSLSSYPVRVTIEGLNMTDDKSRTEIVHAKFVVGADGAHSWVRKALEIEMEGEQTDSVWGVVDIVPETDFPDIRKYTSIHSKHGSGIIIPREGDIVRFYIELLDASVGDLFWNARVEKGKMTPQQLVSVLRKILHPFQLADVKEFHWWTIYTVQQGLASSYSVKDRVFIAGDACHTHSPKAGQGMNASMNDTHNLAWKLTQVLRRWSSPSLLETYESERRKFAQYLVNFDKSFAALYSERQRTAENVDLAPHEQTVKAFQESIEFITGISIQYSPSIIVDPRHQAYAKNLIIGRRMPPQVFVRAADIRPIEIQDLLPSDIRFKVLFFVGNLAETRVAELKLLAEKLNEPSSFLREFSPDGRVSAVFEIITITTGVWDDINYLRVPVFFRPHWTKVLFDDTKATGGQGVHGYKAFGIDPSQVTIVIVRPDGYVGTIAPSTAIADLHSYFGSFMFPHHPRPRM